MPDKPIALKDLEPEEVPAKLKADYYFDFQAHPFDHSVLFTATHSIIDAIAGIGNYVALWLADRVERPDDEQSSIDIIAATGGPATTQMRRSLAAVEGLASKTESDYPGRCAGRFQVLLEDGATFEPAFVCGCADERKHALYVAKGTSVLGANIWLDDGSIYVGEDTVIEPGVGIKGATIIGKENEIRQGAYFRGNCITGDGCTLRGELKNTVIMDGGNFPHPSYLGDSLCGFETHFGNQATSANLGIFAVLARDPIVLDVDGTKYDLGRPKIGIIMGDYSQVGCNSVSDPGTFLAPWTIVYQLTRLNKGFYGPRELLKNKPMEHGIIERSPLKKPAT